MMSDSRYSPCQRPPVSVRRPTSRAGTTLVLFSTK
ncbi:hypothetical protein DSM3645_03703 [Blastopirellula marina DSM 3645]|uniref:Uncharacterized protein n=1 Tax=Blastopirellula marina DSM 3645 TaxID=314230 RepID=A3ZW52_9BACT|nr:hypothetical protein DSM3645_03703 [Blastopirellula marina DSM 3645]